MRVDLLLLEIQNTYPSVVMLEYENTSAWSCNETDPGILAGVQTIIDSFDFEAAATAHNQAIIDSTPKIYNFVKPELKFKHFHDINYKSELMSGYNLKPVYVTWVAGNLTKVEWYSDEERTNKVIIVEIDYEMEETTNNFVRRTVTRKWVNNDESINSEFKLSYKDYFTNPSQQLDASRTRRGNVLDNVAVSTIGILMQVLSMSQADAETEGSLLLTKYETELAIFNRSSNTAPIHAALNTDTEFAWLNTDLTPLGMPGVTLRMFLINEVQ